MNRDEAAAQLADVARAEERLAQKARWPFHRHAMFGLMEGLLITSVSQPGRLALPMIAVSFALGVVCVAEDRRSQGMFVSGWRKGPTLPLTCALALFIMLMALAAMSVRDATAAQPLGYLLGAFTFAVCTAASLWWERIYRSALGRGGAQ